MTYWHKVQMSCRQTQPVVLRRGVQFRHGSTTKQAGGVNSSSARTLCGIGIAAYVATFLVGIFYLPLSRLYLASLEKASPIQTWPAGRLRSREFEDTCTNADGWHEWKLFQIGDVVFGFPTRACERSWAVRIPAPRSRGCSLPPLHHSKSHQTAPLNSAPLSPTISSRSGEIAPRSLKLKIPLHH